ncbi:MAG: hypothetical protein IJS59_09580, partial [Bacteroidaceae bacterium]|nr:hypothetical protein [Bacteroidaceae bacterium]
PSTLHPHPSTLHLPPSTLPTPPSIDTYDDHRMALAFAPLSLLAPISINNPQVVTKSYPHFWSDLQAAGFSLIHN